MREKTHAHRRLEYDFPSSPSLFSLMCMTSYFSCFAIIHIRFIFLSCLLLYPRSLPRVEMMSLRRSNFEDFLNWSRSSTRVLWRVTVLMLDLYNLFLWKGWVSDPRKICLISCFLSIQNPGFFFLGHMRTRGPRCCAEEWCDREYLFFSVRIFFSFSTYIFGGILPTTDESSFFRASSWTSWLE